MDPIIVNLSGNDESREPMLRWLREFNYAANGDFMRSLEAGAENEMYLSATDAVTDAIVGGLLANTCHRWLRIDLMSVESASRRQGVGSQLVQHAERIAVARGCDAAYVDTMSFQAPGFYVCLGYHEVGRLQNWDSHGHDKIFFAKELA